MDRHAKTMVSQLDPLKQTHASVNVSMATLGKTVRLQVRHKHASIKITVLMIYHAKMVVHLKVQ